MQLTLPTTFVQPSVAAGPTAPRGAVPPSRDAVAMSQLDRIAAQNLRAPAHGLGGTAMLLALVGGLVVLGSASLWRGAAADEPKEPRKELVAESRPAPAVVTTATTALAPELATPVTAAAQEPIPQALATPEPIHAAVAAADPSADEATRKARARQALEARRKAAQVTQERVLAEETQRQQLAQQQQQQQRDAERAQQQIAEQARQRTAAELARSQSLQVALDTRRSVGETCSGAGSVFSRQFCRTRECSKAEHQGDSVCVRLREDEQAQQRASNER